MKRSDRYRLLPTWIQVFSWIFLVIGGGAAAFVLIGAVFNGTGNVSLHGLQYSGSLRAPWPLALGLVFGFYGYAAFLLLWGKEEGRRAGIAAGYLGMTLCLLAVTVAIMRSRLYIPIDPLLQVPFVLKLHRLKQKWHGEAQPAASDNGDESPSLS